MALVARHINFASDQSYDVICLLLIITCSKGGGSKVFHGPQGDVWFCACIENRSKMCALSQQHAATAALGDNSQDSCGWTACQTAPTLQSCIALCDVPKGYMPYL